MALECRFQFVGFYVLPYSNCNLPLRGFRKFISFEIVVDICEQGLTNSLNGQGEFG